MTNMEREGLLGDKKNKQIFCWTIVFQWIWPQWNGVAHGQRGYIDTCQEQEDKDKNLDLYYHDEFDPLHWNYIHHICVKNDLKNGHSTML